MLIFFISVKLPLGFVSMLIAHTTLGLPFVALTVLARLAEFDEHLVEAARDLGATEAQAFRYVILPVIMEINQHPKRKNHTKATKEATKAPVAKKPAKKHHNSRGGRGRGKKRPASEAK